MHACEPVNRFMTEEVLSIDLDSPAGEILRLFAEYPVHHLPVVEKTKVVGMLSSADVLKLQAFLPQRSGNPVSYLSRHMHIDQVMRRPPITVGAHDSIEHAASLMVKHGIHSLAVTDAADNLIGIITTTDIMHAALHPERRGNGQAATEPSRDSPRFSVSPSEMRHALSQARELEAADDGRGELARALLHAHSRLRVLENVLSCAHRYVHAGQDERLHIALLKAIGRARSDAGENAAEGAAPLAL
jgi:acetoin utilization protein AcuB